jgi:glycine oxidase
MNKGGEVVILGGGVIGMTTAYFLARDGVRVRVLDRGQVGREASWAGAGILPPSDCTTASDPCDRLRALSVRLFPDLSSELRERTGIDNGYARCGGLAFLNESDDVAAHEWCGEGTATEVLDSVTARRLEPELAPGLGRALRLPGMAQLRNPWHLRALQQACLRTERVRIDEGVEARECVRKGPRLQAVRTDKGLVEADTFLIAAGAWADALLGSLGVASGITPVRGQIALLNPGRVLFRHVLIWGSQYLVSRQDGRVLAGSTEEHAGFVKQTTAVGIAGLLDLAVRLVPALARADVERCWAGLRPGSRDGLPFIGRVPGLSNAYVAAGHFRSGIQLSPGTAQLLKEMILGQPLAMPVEAFRLERVTHDE